VITNKSTAIKAPPPYIVVTNEVLGEMVTAIVDAVQPEKVILFGSRAGGNAGKNSDVDLLVLQREPFGKQGSRLEQLAKIRRALKRFFVPRDVLIYSLDDLEKLQDFPGHIIHECMRDGRVLYERAESSPFATQ